MNKRERDPETGRLLDPSPDDWVCPRCGSDVVQSQVWVDSNTEEIYDSAGGYDWCSECDMNGRDGELNDLIQRSEYQPTEDEE